jgi:hypothetical protein
MKKIVVFLHAYKSKALRESVDSLLQNHSGSTVLSVHVYDRNNLKRQESFSDVSYEHIMWDSTQTRFDCQNNILQQENGDYFLSIDGAKLFAKNWDTELINLLGKDEILSGDSMIEFSKKDPKFFIEKTKTLTDKKISTDWIDRKFVFSYFDVFNKLPSVHRLKYYGEEEVLSLFCFNRGIKIYAISNSIIKDIEKDLLSYDYIPFSITHNYNLVIDMIKNKENIFFGDPIDIAAIESKFDYKFSELSYHPFQENDIEYNPNTSLDDMEGERFFGGIKSIY